MERDYTVGAGSILIAIVVISLVVYYTVPGFNESIKQIADEVFGISAKLGEQQKKEYQKITAESTFESVKKCINALRVKKETCTCYLRSTYLPEDYYIRTIPEDDKLFLKLEKGNLKVEGTEKFPLEGLNFCILESDLKNSEKLPEFVISSRKGRLKVNADVFAKDSPEFYKLVKGNEQNICFVVESEIKEEEAKKIREISDCATGNNVAEERMLKWFEEFVANYERCKTYKDKTYCLCDLVDFEELYEGYDIYATQNVEKKETTFSLYYTKDKPQLVKSSKVQNNIFGLDLHDLEKKTSLRQWQNEGWLGVYTPFIFKKKGERVYLDKGTAKPEEMESCAPGYISSKDCKKPKESNIKSMRNRLIGNEDAYTYDGKSYRQIIEEMIEDRNMRLIIASIIPGESGFNRLIEVARTKDKGLMQFNEGTAKGFEVCDSSGCKYVCHPSGCSTNDRRTEPYVVIPAAAKLMEQNLNAFKEYPYPNRELFALASYNAGPESVKKAIQAAKDNGRRPTWENAREEVTADLLKTTRAYRNVKTSALKKKVDIIKCYPDKVHAYKLAFEHEFKQT